MTTLFYTKESPFSNFYPCKFTFMDNEFSSSEQAFMACKAAEFGDQEALVQIMAAKAPLTAKRLGRKVRGFTNERWDAVREQHMFDVCFAKFSQNADLRALLLETGETVLGEASPRDHVWGIGMGASNPDAKDPSKWRGRNLLGKTLMRVRDALREDTQAPEAAAKRTRVETTT